MLMTLMHAFQQYVYWIGFLLFFIALLLCCSNLYFVYDFIIIALFS